MRYLISSFLLLLAFTPAVRAQNTDSLADVARASRAHTASVKHSWDDQNSDFGRSPDDSGTACGAAIAGLPDGYVSSLIGKTDVDPDLSKALVRWMDKHPDLDVMHPEDIAKIMFPVTVAQLQQNQATAKNVAAKWVREASQPAQPNAGDSAAPSPAANFVYKTDANITLARAIDTEQQRRVRSDGSPSDKLAEAVNLYSICESRRMIQFEGDVDKLAKQEFQKQITGGSEIAQGN